jgi:hypothetical protein
MRIKNIRVYARIKFYRAETNIYVRFMHPYKRCKMYTNPFIQILGGTHYKFIKKIYMGTSRTGSVGWKWWIKW